MVKVPAAAERKLRRERGDSLSMFKSLSPGAGGASAAGEGGLFV